MDAPIDLRSDTVSKPSAAMRQAMASAEVGDDRYGDDPTVNRLQDLAAELTGKEAAVFLPTGLAEGPGRLHEDHANARRLAEGVAETMPGAVDPADVATNIVFADVVDTGHDAREWADLLAAEGVLVSIVGGRVRMLTHVGVSAGDIAAAVGAWRRAAAKAGLLTGLAGRE